MTIEKSIYQHYLNQEAKRLISEPKCESSEYVQDEFKKAIIDTEQRLEVKLKNGLCSKLLKEQISRHRLNLGEKFNQKVEFYNASEIIDIIGFVEKNQLKGTEFKKEILVGYSKIHHGTYSGIGYSIIRNIKEYWYKNGKIRRSRRESFNELLNKYERHGIVPVANAMHTRAMNSKELKGEWIIFKNFNGKKYFLCLATHTEGDEFIYETKIKPCLEEFPELTKK